MLKITIELLPGGDPTRRRKIGVMHVGNANPRPAATHSDYHVAWITGEAEEGKPAPFRSTMIKEVPRPEARPWEFLRGVLERLSL